MTTVSAPRYQNPEINCNQLDAIKRVGRLWIKQLPIGDTQRSEAIQLVSIIELSQGTGDFSAKAMESVRDVFCPICRHIHPGIASLCSPGRGLNSCWLMGLLD
jgi:hypothetical protein